MQVRLLARLDHLAVIAINISSIAISSLLPIRGLYLHGLDSLALGLHLLALRFHVIGDEALASLALLPLLKAGAQLLILLREGDALLPLQAHLLLEQVLILLFELLKLLAQGVDLGLIGGAMERIGVGAGAGGFFAGARGVAGDIDAAGVVVGALEVLLILILIPTRYVGKFVGFKLKNKWSACLVQKKLYRI